jgi:hypothetical protein
MDVAMIWMLGALMSPMHVIKIIYAPLVSSHTSLLFLTKQFFLQNGSGNARPRWRQSAPTTRAKHGAGVVTHARGS